ncbi:unnamed protein product [Gordionus sp. m RMFG-2023]
MKSIPSNLKRHITSQHPNIMKADESNSDSSFNARNTAKEKFPKIKIDKSKEHIFATWKQLQAIDPHEENTTLGLRIGLL